jgi:hypothetical protein
MKTALVASTMMALAIPPIQGSTIIFNSDPAARIAPVASQIAFETDTAMRADVTGAITQNSASNRSTEKDNPPASDQSTDGELVKDQGPFLSWVIAALVFCRPSQTLKGCPYLPSPPPFSWEKAAE